MPVNPNQKSLTGMYQTYSDNITNSATHAQQLFGIGPIHVPRFGFMQSASDKKAIENAKIMQGVGSVIQQMLNKIEQDSYQPPSY